MGTNKRYDLYTPKLTTEREERERKPHPVSLPDGVVRSTGRRRDETPPVPVRALVPVRVVYDDVVEVEADAIAWTPGGAVLIRYTPAGERFPEYVWLWANAVQRIGHPSAPKG